MAFPKSANSKKKKSLPNSEKKTLESRGNDDIGEDEADQADHLDDDTSPNSFRLDRTTISGLHYLPSEVD